MFFHKPTKSPIFEGFVVSEVLKSQWARGLESEVYYFRDEQGLEVDLLFSPYEGRLTLAECKSSATVTPDMSLPMRHLAKAFAKDGLQVDMRLVYNPISSARRSPTVGEGVKAVSVSEFSKGL